MTAQTCLEEEENYQPAIHQVPKLFSNILSG